MMHPRPAYPKSIHNYNRSTRIYNSSERNTRPPPYHHPPRVVNHIVISYTNHYAIHTRPPPSITHQFLYTCRPLIPQWDPPSPTTHQETIQSCVPERQFLSQSCTVVFPPAYIPSFIKSSIPDSHSTKPIQSVIPLPAHPTYIHTDSPTQHSIRPSVLRTLLLFSNYNNLWC
ncbi:hypothetical protein T03_16266 [Trichinella britovi]|uniref:Uncharacterized protein n=1 Tax=Trichinella britovi TaxID=45882 RepID=A0A0V1C6Y0_TRIBR|nr:hypothetical protein T03_16266 [Trichinella britovi]